MMPEIGLNYKLRALPVSLGLDQRRTQRNGESRNRASDHLSAIDAVHRRSPGAVTSNG